MMTQSISETILETIQVGDLTKLLARVDTAASECDFWLEEEHIQAALEAGFTRMASVLIAHDRFNIEVSSGELLHKAINFGYLEIAKSLVVKGVPVNRHSKELGSPLQLALEREYFPLATLMLKNGAEISIRDAKGWSPLIWASIVGREKIVDFLLEHGADIHPCNNDGWNAITGAYVKRHLVIVEKLRSKGAYFGQKYADAVLLSAFKDAQCGLFVQLIKDGANVNLTNDNGDPLLALAIARGDQSAVKILIEHGADPNAKLGDGSTCLNTALKLANFKAAEILIRAGADPNDCGSSTWAPLHQAATHGATDICALLIEKGAAINQPTGQDGWTALMLAATGDHLDAVKKLREMGADLNLKSNKGKRARSLVGEYKSGFDMIPMNSSGQYLKDNGGLL